MSWQNPWAWIGLLALVVPLLVHLLARRTARVLPFPTLRFLTTSPLLATQRTRLTDLLLLAVRCAVVLAAVAALAQPYWHNEQRAARASRSSARVIVVDTSASMRRASNGVSATDVAHQEAARVAAAAGPSIVVETASPDDAIAGAAAWLETHAGRRELVVLSDFQLGTLDSLGLTALPSHIGIRLQRIATPPDSSVLEHVVRHADAETVARVSFQAERTDIEWSRRAAPAMGDGLTMGGADSAGLDAARRAAQVYGAPSVDVNRPITLVSARAVDQDPRLTTAAPLSAPWMGDLLAALAHDPLLQSIAANAALAPVSGAAPVRPWVTVLRTPAGEPLLHAAQADRGLLLWTKADARDPATAALVVAASRAGAATASARELEPRTLTDAQLERWQRASTPGPQRSTSGGESDGRWLWLAALLLLAVESWLRRRPGAIVIPRPGADARRRRAQTSERRPGEVAP